MRIAAIVAAHDVGPWVGAAIAAIARRAKHWWGLLVRALESGDSLLLEEVMAARPEPLLRDFFSHHFLRYLARRGARTKAPQPPSTVSNNHSTKEPGPE
ncbi:MAG: hypothetical protein WBI27_19760 [Thermoanaerobaculia bacterium]